MAIETPPADPPDGTENKKTPENNDSVPSSWDEVFEHPRFKTLVAKAGKLTQERDDLLSQIESAKNEQLKEKEDFKALAEKYKGELDAANTSLKEAQLSSLRSSIAADVGLNPKLADRLIGNDEESIRADAESMVQLQKTEDDPPPKGNIDNKAPGTQSGSRKLTDMKPSEIASLSPEEKAAIIQAA